MSVIPYNISNEYVTHEGVSDPISSIGWDSKACFYFKHMFDPKHIKFPYGISIPDNGKIVQIGSALGCSLQLLVQRFGEDRVIGIDPFNPLKHPNVQELTIQEVFGFPCAFIHCDAGDFRTTKALRLYALEWSLTNLVPGGVCLTAGHNARVDDLLDIDLVDFAMQHRCTIRTIPIWLKNRTDRKFTESDCIIMKNK